MLNIHKLRGSLNFTFTLAALLLLPTFSAFAQTVSNNSQKLTINKPLERTIKGGETQEFQFELKKGEYARVEVEQKNIDVIVSLFDADGKLVVKMDGKDGFLWREAVSAIAETGDAVFQVKIRAYGWKEQAGNYTIKLAEVRPVQSKDRQRLEAEQHFYKGRQLSTQDNPDFENALKEYEAALKIRQELGDKQWQAVAQYAVGYTKISLKQFEQSIANFSAANELFKEIGDRGGEGFATHNLGRADFYLRNYKDAESYFKQALAIRREIKDRINESITLRNLGIISFNLKQLKEADDYLKKVLIITRELNNRAEESIVLDMLGFNSYIQNQFEEAIEYYEKYIEIQKENVVSKKQSDVLIKLGNAYAKLTQYDKAEDYFEQSLLISRKIKDRSSEGEMLRNLGIIYENLGQPEKAKDYSEKALVINREINNREGEGRTLNVLGNIYSGLSQYDKAKDYYEQSLLIAREIKNRSDEVQTLNNLGNVYNRLNEYDKAKDYYEQALLIARQFNDRRSEGSLLNNLGIVYQELGQYEKAKDYYEQALLINRELNDRRGEGGNLNSMGNVYEVLGQYEKAKNYYEQALLIVREVNDRRGEGGLLNNLGNIYETLWQYEKAKDYYEQALLIAREVKDLRGAGKTLGNLGNVYYRLNKFEKAKEYYDQALLIAREVKDRRGEGDNLNSLGVVYKVLGQYEKAKNYYEQALLTRRELSDRHGEGDTASNLLVLWEKLNKPNLAIIYGKQSVNAYQKIRGNIKGLDKELQKSFLAGRIETYRRLSDILISEGRLAEAQAVLDLIKEGEYEQISVRRSGEDADTVPYSKSEADAIDKIDKLAELGRRKTELEKQEKDKGSLPETERKELDKIFADIETANKAFRESLEKLKNSEASVGEKLAEVESEKNLQRTLGKLSKELDTGAVAIYTVIGTDSEKDSDGKEGKDKTRSKFGWVILVTPDSRKAYPIDVKDLEETVFQLRNALSSDKYDPQPLAGKLYAAIFRQTSRQQKQTLEADLEKLLAQYKDKTIMWSLDGVLRYIPMAALHDGEKYLVEKYRHIVFTKESLAYFNDEDSPNWQALGLGVSEAKTVKDSISDKDVSFNAIPGTEKEINDIVKTSKEDAGIFDGAIRLNKDFTKEETFRLWRQGKYPVIHIASHFSFNPVDQTASFLLIGDGKLTFSDIKDKDNLFGAVDLLTISACDTAMSGNGKESEGFAYLAQSLGAKTVLASLWKIPDAGTPELMIRFYKLRKENPQLSKGEAFRRAQIEMLGAKTAVGDGSDKNRSGIVSVGNGESKLSLFAKDKKHPFAHPHYWAAFVLIGNWR